MFLLKCSNSHTSQIIPFLKKKNKRRYYWVRYTKRMFFIKKKLKRKWILKRFFIINSYTFLVNTRDVSTIFKIKKKQNLQQNIYLRKKKIIEKFKPREKIWKKRRWLKIQLRKHQMWYLTNLYDKVKIFKPLKVYKKKKKFKKKKKIKFIKKLLVYIIKKKFESISLVKRWEFDKTLSTNLQLWFNPLSYMYISFSSNNVKSKYLKCKYTKLKFNWTQRFNLKKFTEYKSIKYLKYHEKQKPLKRLKRVARILRWAKAIIGRRIRF